MLQRIQTVYLLLAFIVVVVAIFFPIVTFESEAFISEISPLGITYTEGQYEFTGPYGIPPIAGYGLLAILILVQLLQFKNRKRQMAIGRWLYILIIAQVAFNYVLCGAMAEPVSAWGLAFYGPVAALPFIFLANRAIKKDEELVRSIDRLR